MVNFDIIDKTNNDFPKGDKSRILIVLYHKQKIIGMDFCEGKVEYLGKNGMSILG